MTAFANRILDPLLQKGGLFAGLMLLLLVCVLGYLASDEWIILLVPFGLLAMAWGLRDFRMLYLAIWATIPFAIEVDLPGGLSTDFPAEPLMWLTCFLLPVYFFLHHKEMDIRFIFHPIFVLLTIHFFWILFTSVISQEPLISLKFTFAKSWYLACFILVPLLFFREVHDFKTWGLFLIVPLILSVVIILIRHSQYGFTFSTINNAVIPIYRNHVDYACSLGILLPFVWFLRPLYESKWIRFFLLISMVIMVTGIYFSYTRAAWLCIPVAIGSYIIIRLKWMRIMIPLALAGAILVVGWLAYDNNYISYSPDYEKAITHKHFDDLVSATYKMEDISTVERFYRWVAGYYMVKEKPLTGFGPSSFYSVYHSYVDRHFTTYVSDNPERSGMHNYYLMTAVEQGLIGLGIFLAIIITVLLMGERLYHQLPAGPKKIILMAALISFCCNLFIMTLNDTVETDKLGTIFFFCMAIVIIMGMQASDMSRITQNKM